MPPGQTPRQIWAQQRIDEVYADNAHPYFAKSGSSKGRLNAADYLAQAAGRGPAPKVPGADQGLIADGAPRNVAGPLDGGIRGKGRDRPDKSSARIGGPAMDISVEHGRKGEDRFSVPELPRSTSQTLNYTTKTLINIDNDYQELQFSPKGPSDYKEALNKPINGVSAGALSAWAIRATENLKEAGRLPKTLAHNDAADAFRHTYWSYQMEKYLSKGAAKAIGDAHERDRGQPNGERLMDLHNNAVGRRLAADPANARMDDDEVVLKALREKKLRITPFNVEASGRSENRAARHSTGSQ